MEGDAANRYPAGNFVPHDYTFTSQFSLAAGSDPLILFSLGLQLCLNADY
jgi:hypothetical protein